jgi:hypothetical protein
MTNERGRESKKCLHCDYMRRPIQKEVPAHGLIDTWEYCPVHGIYSDWGTELPEWLNLKRRE